MENHAIKEGDYVRVPYTTGQPIFGQVRYIKGLFAEVALMNRFGGRTGRSRQFRVADLKMTAMKSEEEMRREYAQEKA